MPEPLKKAIGLAGREREEAIVRYHVERLIHSSKEAHLIWQSSTMSTSSGLEGKKMRSRFVEGLLWKEEREKTTLLDECVNKVPLLISPESCLKGDGLTKKPSDQQSVQEFVRDRSRKGGLSASLLNTYLGCPLKFYYKYLLGLKPVLSVPEDTDSTSLGERFGLCRIGLLFFSKSPPSMSRSSFSAGSRSSSAGPTHDSGMTNSWTWAGSSSSLSA